MNPNFFQRLIGIAALVGALGVMMGAFGAHALKAKISAESLEVLKTGVFYLFIHVIASLITCLLAIKTSEQRWLKLSAILFLLGILLFSGSLFLISTQSLTGINISMIGFVTPLGGLCFIVAWIGIGIWGLKASIRG